METMDAPNAPAEPLSPPEIAAPPPARANDCPHSYRDGPLGPEATAGEAVAGHGGQTFDHPTPRQDLARLAAAGLDPARFAGHSLRANLATGAGDAGIALADVMRQTRHNSPQVALEYLRPADLWRNNATERLFRS